MFAVGEYSKKIQLIKTVIQRKQENTKNKTKFKKFFQKNVGLLKIFIYN